MQVFLFAVGIVFSSILSPGIGQGENSRSTALILYPKAALSYFHRMNTRPNCECVSEFKTLSRQCRKSVCMEFLADAVPFHVSSEERSFEWGNLRALIEETYDTIPDPFIDELSFSAPDEATHKTSGQWCIKKSGHDQWAVSAGLHQGVMLVYKEPINTPLHSADFELFGLSEEIPYFRHQMSQQELDRRYLTGTCQADDDSVIDVNSLSVPENRNTSVPQNLDELVKSNESDEDDESDSFEFLNDEQRGEPTELCSLNSYERLRVCAVTYLALHRRENLHPELDETHEGKDQRPKLDGVLLESNVLQDEPKCVDGVIDVDSGELSSSSVPPPQVVGVLSCLINSASAHPFELLLVNDRYTTNSVFVVEDSPYPLDRTLHGTPRRTFKLKHFLTNVRVLKPFDVTF